MPGAPLHVTGSVWLTTIGCLVGMLAVDHWWVGRHGLRPFRTAEATGWVVFYLALAALFGAGVWAWAGPPAGGAFVAGFLTEYSLSVDNLFVFVVVLAQFRVPAAAQHRALLFGIALALALRGAFIAVGAAAVQRFTFTFFVFGAFLLCAAGRLLVGRHGEADRPPRLQTFLARVLPSSAAYDGARFTRRVDGRRLLTPLVAVVVTLGATDVLFALDSIPAIFGLTREPYLVFTANAFALLGLRQVYFLLEGLLDRLVYLSQGLAVILGFIGVKLVLQAARSYGASWAPEWGNVVSLSVIVTVLTVTTAASRWTTRRTAGSLDRPLPGGRR